MGQPVGETNTGLEPAVSKERVFQMALPWPLSFLAVRVSLLLREFLCFEMAYVVLCFKTDFELWLLLVLPLQYLDYRHAPLCLVRDDFSPCTPPGSLSPLSCS